MSVDPGAEAPARQGGDPAGPGPLDDTLAALADPTRRRVVEMLRERPHRAGELASAFEVSAPAISRHLRVLRTRGIVEEERDARDARLRIYRLRPDRFLELSRWLEEIEAVWTDQLASFKAWAERPDRARRAPLSGTAPDDDGRRGRGGKRGTRPGGDGSAEDGGSR